MKYLFGARDSYTSNDLTIIEANSLEFAILKFAYTVSSYNQYLDDDTKRKFRETHDEYIHDYHEIPEDLKTTAYIPIYEQISINKNGYADYSKEPVKKLFLNELENINFKDTENKFNEAKNTDNVLPMMYKQDSLEVDMDNLPAEFREGKIQTTGDFLNKGIQLRQMIESLEQEKYKLKKQIAEMEKWLRNKYRVICAFETYLGTHEEIVELISEGKTSTEPIHFYQLVLYMDEEFGIANIEKIANLDFIEQKDFDYNDIHFFDDWIKENYKLFIPAERGVRMWRIKRNDKNYNDKIANMIENDKNKNCYFLIRNGERLYRIFSDVSSFGGTLFPTDEQMEEAGKRWQDGKFDEEQFNEKLLPWKYITVALQGLLDRTDILGTDNQFKHNLFSGNIDTSKLVLVRDAEWKNLIEDNSRPRFNDFMSENVEKTKVGDRILLTRLWGTYDKITGCFSNKNHDHEFIYMHEMNYLRTWCDIPNTSLVYQVKDIGEFGGVKKYKILYFEDEREYGVPRKKRTACWVDDSEFLNLSNMTKEDILFYLKDRRERKYYLDILPKMSLALRYLTTKAYEREDYYKEYEN